MSICGPNIKYPTKQKLQAPRSHSRPGSLLKVRCGARRCAPRCDGPLVSAEEQDAPRACLGSRTTSSAYSRKLTTALRPCTCAHGKVWIGAPYGAGTQGFAVGLVHKQTCENILCCSERYPILLGLFQHACNLHHCNPGMHHFHSGQANAGWAKKVCHKYRAASPCMLRH